MAVELSKVVVRQATVNDVDHLHRLIVDSTGGRTRITPASLKRELFVDFDPTILINDEVKLDDKCLEINPELIKRNKSVAQAFLAEANEGIIGYLIFHYHYSPWTGHCAFVDDIYTSPVYRRKGIARKLALELWALKERESLSMLIFHAENLSPELRDTISKFEPEWVRNDEKDWSVCRIPLGKYEKRSR